MLRHRRHCNPITFWLDRELGWDLLSGKKIKISSKKNGVHLFLQKLEILGFQVLKSLLGPIVGKTPDGVRELRF